MKFSEFKNGIETGGKPSAIYLFEGEDAYFREKGLQVLKSRFLSEPSLNYAVFDGGETSFGELLSSVTAYPFMSEKRITAIREFYPKKETASEFTVFAENPSETGILVIMNEKPCDYLKKIKTVCIVDCSKADTATLARWIKGTCRAAGVEIQSETAANVAVYCLSDMTRISTETDKLISYAGKGGTITDEDVKILVPQDAEHKVYEMTDFIGKKKFDSALSVISDMLGKGETPQRIILSVYNYFRRLLLSAISGKTPAQLAECFGIKEFAAAKTREQAKMFRMRSLKKAVDALIDADYKIKSGAADADETMWITVFSIMTDGVA